MKLGTLDSSLLGPGKGAIRDGEVMIRVEQDF